MQASCVEYITLLGDSLSSVFPSAHLAFTGIDLSAHNLFAITMALAILPSVWLRNLSLLSYLSGKYHVESVQHCLLSFRPT
jgi:vesicular inhibitory amino acid transporter